MISHFELMARLDRAGVDSLASAHLEDRVYPIYKKSDVKDLLRDFKVKAYVPEHCDCDDQADDMRNYLRKNGVKVGFMKVTKHMKLIFATNKSLASIDPGTKKITGEVKDVKYLAWW